MTKSRPLRFVYVCRARTVKCMLRSIHSSRRKHDRLLPLGDNMDSPRHGEATRQYHRFLPCRHFIAFAMVLSGNVRGARLQQGPAMAAGRLCSVTVTEHHFCNSRQFRCASLLRMAKNAFWDKMHVPRTCSIAVCDRAMQLGCDARTVPMLSSAVCASAMHGMRSTLNIAGNFSR